MVGRSEFVTGGIIRAGVWGGGGGSGGGVLVCSGSGSGERVPAVKVVETWGLFCFGLGRLIWRDFVCVKVGSFGELRWVSGSSLGLSGGHTPRCSSCLLFLAPPPPSPPSSFCVIFVCRGLLPPLI